MNTKKTLRKTNEHQKQTKTNTIYIYINNKITKNKNNKTLKIQVTNIHIKKNETNKTN